MCHAAGFRYQLCMRNLLGEDFNTAACVHMPKQYLVHLMAMLYPIHATQVYLGRPYIRPMEESISDVDDPSATLLKTALRSVVFLKLTRAQDFPRLSYGTYYQKLEPRQLEAVKLLREAPGDGCAFTEGFSVVKLLSPCMLANPRQPGKHVLIVAPTNATVQAISDYIIKHIDDIETFRAAYTAICSPEAPSRREWWLYQRQRRGLLRNSEGYIVCLITEYLETHGACAREHLRKALNSSCSTY